MRRSSAVVFLLRRETEQCRCVFVGEGRPSSAVVFLLGRGETEQCRCVFVGEGGVGPSSAVVFLLGKEGWDRAVPFCFCWGGRPSTAVVFLLGEGAAVVFCW